MACTTCFISLSKQEALQESLFYWKGVKDLGILLNKIRSLIQSRPNLPSVMFVEVKVLHRNIENFKLVYLLPIGFRLDGLTV